MSIKGFKEKEVSKLNFRAVYVFNWTRWAAERLARVKVRSQDVEGRRVAAPLSFCARHSGRDTTNVGGSRVWRHLNSNSD